MKFKERSKNKNSRILAALALSSVLAVGCGDDREDFIVTRNQAPAPIAVDDTVTAIGNARLLQSAANGVLGNDTVSGAGISAFDAVSTQGGTVALNADGSFTYSPLFGFTGTDTFTYTLTNTTGQSTATVTVNVPNQGFFVNNQVAPGGNGSQAAPFNNLADARAAAASGDTIYVFRGDGTPFAGGFTLADGVNLIGEGNGLVVAQQIEAAGINPEMGGIALAGNNTVSGFTFTGNVDGITANGVSNITITNNTFQTNDQAQVDLDNIGGSLAVSNNTFELQGNDYGLELDQENTNATVEVMNNTVRLLASGDGTGNDGLQLEFDGTSAVTATVSGNTVTGSGSSSGATNISTGLDFDIHGTSVVSLTMNNNNVRDVASQGVYIEVYNDASLTANCSGNSITNIPDQEAFYLGIDTPEAVSANIATLTVDRVGDDAQDHGLELDIYGTPANVTATLSGSTFSNTTGDNFYVRNRDDLFLTLTDNNFSSAGDVAVDIDGNTDSSTCLDISGNTFNGDNLDLNADNNAVMDVEQLNELEDPTVNTFSNGAELRFNGLETFMGAGTINNRPNGFCTTP